MSVSHLPHEAGDVYTTTEYIAQLPDGEVRATFHNAWSGARLEMRLPDVWRKPPKGYLHDRRRRIYIEREGRQGCQVH